MQQIDRLPAAPRVVFDHSEHGLVLVFPHGVGILRHGALEWLVRGPVGGAARGPEGALYCTLGTQIVRLEPGREGEPQDVTSAFGGPPGGRRRVCCAPDGSLWVEGCPCRRRLDGSYEGTPAGPDGGVPAGLLAVDYHANAWGLTGTGKVAVLPAQAPEAWQLQPLAGDGWDWLVADSKGFIWVAGQAGLRRFDPRDPENGWQAVVAGRPADAPTAVGLSPDELLAAGFGTGEVLELDVSAKGEVLARHLTCAPGPPRALHTDEWGALWVATDDGLYRRGPEADAWQHTWQKQGRLPGSNHDIFAAVLQGRLWVAGGLTWDWGLPARWHVFDELWSLAPARGCWELTSRMSFRRRYSGIAAFDGRIWVVGGEAKFKDLEDPKGEAETVDVVDIYDPAANTWTAGPRLNTVRTDPFVIVEAGRLWAVGGACNPTTPLASVESIGPGEAVWRWEAPLPVPTRQGGGCALDGVLYCASTEGFFGFDTATRTWIPDLPQLEKGPMAPLVAAFAGEVWVMGGHLSRATYRYAPQERRWRTGPALPTLQSWGAAAALEGRLYVAGGAHWSESYQRFVFDDRTYVLRPGWG